MVEISKHLFDQTCRDVDCHVLLHYYDPSCWTSIPETFRLSMIGSARFYAIVYLVSFESNHLFNPVPTVLSWTFSVYIYIYVFFFIRKRVVVPFVLQENIRLDMSSSKLLLIRTHQTINPVGLLNKIKTIHTN